MNVTKLHTGLQSLVIFRDILKDPVIEALDRYLAAPAGVGEERVGLYCEFVTVLYSKTEQFSRYLLELILEDENLYVTRKCAEGSVGACLEECLDHELEFLQSLSAVSAKDMTAHLEYTGYLPTYVTEALDLKALFHEPDGFVLIYKRLSVKGGYQWPRKESEVRNLTWREFDWLMSGIDIDQPKALRLE